MLGGRGSKTDGARSNGRFWRNKSPKGLHRRDAIGCASGIGPCRVAAVWRATGASSKVWRKTDEINDYTDPVHFTVPLFIIFALPSLDYLWVVASIKALRVCLCVPFSCLIYHSTLRFATTCNSPQTGAGESGERIQSPSVRK